MKAIALARLTTAAAIALALVVFSGCIKRTSDPVIEETDFLLVTKINVSNPVGKVAVTGNIVRIFNPRVRVEKNVQTHSLLGLANPDNYMNAVAVYQGVNNGELAVGVAVQRLSFLERLFVKVSPRIDFILDAPVALPTDVEVNVGSIEISNMVGDVNGTINVGEMKITSTLGIFGSQNMEVNIGGLDMRFPADMPIRYDLETNIGKIDTAGFDVEADRRLLGARATGESGTATTPSFLKARVNIGNISFQGE